MRVRWAVWGAVLAALLGAWALAASGAEAAQTRTEISGTGSDLGETALGDLVADAVQAAAKAEVALVPAFWLRPVSLPPGEIADAAARGALAFPDEEIAVLALKGSQLAGALERGVALVPRPNKGFLQVAGVAVQFDRRRRPESRITQIVVGEQRLDPDKVYKVAMPLSLARGALGYFRIFNGVAPTATRITLADAVTRFLAAHGLISIKVGTRLVDVGAPPPPKP